MLDGKAIVADVEMADGRSSKAFVQIDAETRHIECKKEHDVIKQEIQKLLDEYHDDGKDPNPIAKGMSWIKTNVKLIVDESDNTIAELMTDGCNMGVKSLNKYLNEYKASLVRSLAFSLCERTWYSAYCIHFLLKVN